MSERLLLLLDRCGVRWRLAHAWARSLPHWAGSSLTATGEGTVAADRVLHGAANLAVGPEAAVVGRHWPEECLGMALQEGVSVVVVSPGALQSVLADTKREISNATRE